MDLAEEFKSRWPIPSSFSSFSSDSKSKPKPQLSNPLIFTPSPQTLTHLLTSPSLFSNLPPPFLRLSLSSFLSPFLLPSTSSSLSSSLPHLPATPSLLHNTLRLLRRPGTFSLLAFFPTGENSDRIGFITILLEGSGFRVEDDARVGVSNPNHNLSGHRIVKLLISPFSGNSSIGFIMACTMYGMQWYSVEFDKHDNPKLVFIGCKVFKSCGVADACWNPHVPEESLVLLENGELFLFDMNDFSSGKRLKFSLKDCSNLGKGGWLGCEFSWHPEIIVIANSCAVFLLDFRERVCVVTRLLDIDTSAIHTNACNDRFVAFSNAGSDRNCFVVASEHRIILFDVRKALIPLLQWAHDIPNPSCINVFPLSQLRVYPEDDDRSKGNCIIMGSFWNCEFNLFCYGPQATVSVASEISKLDNKLCAWDIPSELCLTGRECSCGSCLVREEFWKDSLPAWINWRQKKEIVLGFGILDKDLDSKLSQENGFTLIRLVSSGKIESQRYIPSHDLIKTVKEPLKFSDCGFQDSLLFSDNELEYKFPKRFHYQKLNYLCAYMKDDLDKALFGKMKEFHKAQCKSDYISSVDFHQSVCEKFKKCGFNKPSFAVSNLLTRIRSPSSVHEVALSKFWAHFPSDLLRLAFSYYSQILEVLLDKKKVSLEFLNIPNQPQFPPFIFREPSRRSSKWTRKVRPGTAFVGPVLPTPALLTICKLRKEENSEFSANFEIREQCNEVMEMANKMVTSGLESDFRNGPAVSLGDDRDDIFDDIDSTNLISLHKIVPENATSEDSGAYDEKFTTFICKKYEKEVSKIGAPMVGSEMLDSLSPIELKFDGSLELGDNLDTLMLLQRRYSNYLRNFDPYGQYLEKSDLRKQE